MAFTISAAGIAASTNSPAPATVDSNSIPNFNVRAYVMEGDPLLPANTMAAIVSKYTGTNVSMKEMVKAASDLQSEYHSEGYPAVCIAFDPAKMSDGIVTFNIARTDIPMIYVAGDRFLFRSNTLEIAYEPSAVSTDQSPQTAVVTTNTPPPLVQPVVTRPATPEEMDAVAGALQRKMAELDAESRDTRVHVVATNGPWFDVEKYVIMGNSVLPPAAISEAITNIDGALGTNVSFEGIKTAVTELGKAYHERGYETVSVRLPAQSITNATIKLQVLEGRLADINVVSNRYFSSNNVMRSLPSLHTNMVLNVPIFNAELNRANANQDRQIYPVISPGPLPGTSDLALKVMDRLPLHAKSELNNQASPGTPELRLNSSAVYGNLWQWEHSLGVQYSFSPEVYKGGNQWDFYDEPVVVNYSAFYRLPLGAPESIENAVADNPGSFGYNEATRKFNLPPPTGRPELTLFASRSTIDEGLTTTSSGSVTPPGSNPSISRQNVVDSPTKNEDLGAHLNLPLPSFGNYQSSFSPGLDFKTYALTSYGTNIFFFTQTNFDQNNIPLPPTTTPVPASQPLTVNRFEYLPLSLRYDGNWRDSLGTVSFGLGVSFNVWNDVLYSKTATTYPTTYSTNVTTGVITPNYVTNTTTTVSRGNTAVKNITGSTQSSGYWMVINPSFSRDITIYNWTTLIRADGQWASEPLISPEQFGAGGVNSVRGYPEGEVFGDCGWHVSLEEQTPTHVVGKVYDGTPLTIRGSVYMDYARVYVIDPPPDSPGSTPLWGTGFGFTASAGSRWQAQALFSWPLVSAGTVPAFQPFFNFSLTAQF